MKRLLTILALSLTVAASAQKLDVRAGAQYSYIKGGGAYGGELIATTSGKASVGAGVSLLKFKGMDGAAAPIFARIGYQVLPMLQVHVDPGFIAYNHKVDLLGKDYKTEGQFYFASGVLVSFGRFYADARYSLYQFQSNGSNLPATTSTTNAATISAGIKF